MSQMKSDDSIRPWGHYEILLDTDYCKVKKNLCKTKSKIKLSIPPQKTRSLDCCFWHSQNHYR